MTSSIRTFVFALFACALAVPAWAAHYTVTVQNFSFSPAALSVLPGDTVTWNCTSGSHNVREISSPSAFTSGAVRAATWQYTFVFNVPARVYHYQCDPHAPGMSGTVTVQQASGAEEIHTMSASSFELSQNYPNPFNPSTSIRYELKNESFAQLSVFNVAGQWVADLVKSRQTAGVHEVNFDASLLPSGIYIYRLTSSGRTQAGKMILMK